jgi:M6 family metalloprotease-like protein
MKKGLRLLILLLLTLQVVFAAPPSPEFQVSDDGEIIPIWDPRFDPDDIDKIYTQTGGDGGDVEVFTFKEECPVIFETQKSDEGKKQFKPLYAGIDENGKIIHPEKAGLPPQSPKDIKPTDFKKNEGGVCGGDFIAARPIKPQYTQRNEEDRFNYDRASSNAEKGIGVGYEDGQAVPKNPTVKQGIESGQRPPNLPPPPPEYVYGPPTGYVTYETAPQDLKILVVLVEFTDEAGKSSPEEVYDMFFGNSNSLKSYLEDQSYGQISISGEVTNWYTLSQTMGYYGGNYEANVEDMIIEAVAAADLDYDFSNFDNDADGIIDSFFVVHAGDPDEAGGGNGDEIWSHYFSIPAEVADGIEVIDYETVSEHSPLGITIHEFGHYLGLPDMYDTVYDDGSSKGTGDWSIMGYGGYLDEPGSFDPWSKYFLGWLNEDNYIAVEESGTYDLSQDNIDYGVRYYLLPLAESEYFMLENRHSHNLMKGGEAGGVVIWHIDENVADETGSWNGCSGSRWTCNTVNGDAEHKLVDVEEADGEEELNGNGYGDDADPWYNSCSTFGGCQPYLFYSDSNPSSKSYYGSSENDIAVNVNSEIGGTMSIGISLEGEILETTETEEITTEEEESTQETEVTSTGSKASSGSEGLPAWVFIIIGILILVILGGGIFVGIKFSKKSKGSSIHPEEFIEF